MAINYQLNFDNFAGQQQNWRLDVLRQDYSGPVKPLVGDASPVEIEYVRDDDPYRAIMGSTMTVNLVVTDDVTYDDFYNYPEYTFEVVLRYETTTPGEYRDYWRGWINPSNGLEGVQSAPFPVSFVATDGLGLLSGRPVFRDESSAIRAGRQYLDQTTQIITFIQNILLETGLGLDLYVDSGIRVNGGADDPLVVNGLNEWAFSNEDRTENMDAEEVLEAILTSFNCRISQHHGKWYVYSNSALGGPGTLDTATWKTYLFDDTTFPDRYLEGSTQTENLRYKIAENSAGGTTVTEVIAETTGSGIIDLNNAPTWAENDTSYTLNLSSLSDNVMVGDQVRVGLDTFVPMPGFNGELTAINRGTPTIETSSNIPIANANVIDTYELSYEVAEGQFGDVTFGDTLVNGPANVTVTVYWIFTLFGKSIVYLRVSGGTLAQRDTGYDALRTLIGNANTNGTALQFSRVTEANISIEVDANNPLPAFNPALIFWSVGFQQIETVTKTTGGSDLIATPDFQLNTRRPYGSIQANFPELINGNLIGNGHFYAENEFVDPVGFLSGDGRDLTFSKTTLVESGEREGTARSIVTNFNSVVFDTSSAVGTSDQWFYNNITLGENVDRAYPLTVSFDNLWNNTVSGYADSLKGGYQVSMVFDNSFTSSVFYDTGLQTTHTSLPPIVSTNNNTRYIWNETDGVWDSFSGDVTYNDKYIIRYDTSQDDNEWSSVSKEIPPITPEFTRGFYSTAPGNGRIEIRFFNPEAYLGDNLKKPEGAGNIQHFIDNVRVTHFLKDSQAMPIKERVNSSYSTTLEYEPHLISTGPTTIYNRILGNTDYSRRDTGLEDISIGDSLAEVVTYQKLADFRGNTVGPFKYYEGTFINNTTIPFGPLHKPKVEYSWADSNGVAQTYIEPVGGVFDGGTFSPKENRWDMAFHIPNQTGIFESKFYNQNVDLIAGPPPDRKPTKAYTLGIRGIGLDDSNQPHDTGEGNNFSIVVEDPFSEALNEGYIQVTGSPGDTRSFEFLLSGGVDDDDTAYQLNASNLSIVDTESNPEPLAIQEVSITQVGTQVRVKGLIRIPVTNYYEILEIAGEVDPITENTVSFGITTAITDSTGNLALTTIPVSGESGGVRTIQIPINPNDTRQLVTTGFTHTFSGSLLVNAGVVRSGNGLLWSVTVLLPETAPSSNPVATITNVDDIAASAGDSATFTLNFAENVTNLSMATTSFPITGTPASPFTHFVRANPAPGYKAVHGNDDTSSSSANAVIQDAIEDGDGYLIPITGTIPTGGGSATITLGYTGTVGRLGADFVTTTVSFVTTGLSGATIDEPAPEAFKNGVNTTASNTLLVIPNQGQKFNAVDDVTVGYSSNVSGISKKLMPDGTVSVRYSITFGEGNATGTVTISGSTVNEPYQAVLNVIENLPQGRVVTTPLSTRFSSGDTNLTFTITVEPNEGRMQYPAGTMFTFSNGSASNYSDTSTGGRTFTFTIALPTFNANNPIGDVTLSTTITGVGTTAPPSTSVSVNVPHVGVPATGGSISIFVTADAEWETGGDGEISNGARYSPTSGYGNGVIVFEAPYLPNNLNSTNYGIVVRSADGSNSNQVNLVQNDSYGQRIVFVNTLPSPQQPGILYITPQT